MSILTPFVFISCGVMWWMMSDDYGPTSKMLLRIISSICFIIALWISIDIFI